MQLSPQLRALPARQVAGGLGHSSALEALLRAPPHVAPYHAHKLDLRCTSGAQLRAAPAAVWRSRPHFVPHTASTVLDAHPTAAGACGTPSSSCCVRRCSTCCTQCQPTHARVLLPCNADDPDAAAAAAPSVPPQPAQQPATPAAPFSWTKAWWPVAPLSQLDARKPYPVTMLGHSYVVWFDAPGQQWRVMEDRCPHR